MTVIRRVRALYVAEFALVAGVDNAIRLPFGQRANVPIVTVDGVEQFRKGRTQIETETAAVADLEDPFDFLIQLVTVPINAIFGFVVARPSSRTA